MIQKMTDTGGAGIEKLLTKQQSIGFKQAMDGAWNSKTSLFGHTDHLRRLVNTHIHIRKPNWFLMIPNKYSNIARSNQPKVD